MATNTESQGLLRAYVGKLEDCSLTESQTSVELLIRRAGLSIRITLPNDVHEWFVDVDDSSTGLKAHDWYDYGGYDSREGEEMDRDIKQDLQSFVESVLNNPLRMRSTDRRGANAQLEWQVNGAWKGAVPADGRA